MLYDLNAPRQCAVCWFIECYKGKPESFETSLTPWILDDQQISIFSSKDGILFVKSLILLHMWNRWNNDNFDNVIAIIAKSKGANK